MVTNTDYTVYFTIDELFVTVRDKSLRAYNRLMFLTANYHNKPKLRRLYIQNVCHLEPEALKEIRRIEQKIKELGRATIQYILKYRCNPVQLTKHQIDARHYARYTQFCSRI